MSKWYDPVEEMQRHLNYGKPRLAYRFATHLSRYSPAYTNPDFWLLAIEAAVAVRASEAVLNDQIANARACPAFTDQMDGDVHRWLAMYWVQRGNFDKAREEIHEATALHAGDANREAAILMVCALIEFGEKHFDDAIELHNQAEQVWDVQFDSDRRHHGGMNIKWYFTNRYYRLRAEAAAGGWYYGPMSADYISASGKENRTRRTGAFLAVKFGRLGIWLFDHIVEQRING